MYNGFVKTLSILTCIVKVQYFSKRKFPFASISTNHNGMQCLTEGQGK